MWACARGHLETSVSLYNWNKGPLNVFNSEGHLPLLVARRHGHHQLADHLEQIDKQSKNCLSANLDILSSQQTPPNFITSASGMKTVSALRSTPERTNFTTDAPAATSTPVSKGVDDAENIFKTPHRVQEKAEIHGQLHIQIPSDAVNSPDITHVPHSRDSFARRQSDQMLTIASSENSNNSSSRLKQKLKKRLSVDLLPCEGDPEPVHFSPTHAYQRPVREANSEPHLPVYTEHLTCELNPMLSEHCNNDSSPDGLMQIEGVSSHGHPHHDKSSSMPEDRGPVDMPVNMDTGMYLLTLPVTTLLVNSAGDKLTLFFH